LIEIAGSRGKWGGREWNLQAAMLGMKGGGSEHVLKGAEVEKLRDEWDGVRLLVAPAEQTATQTFLLSKRIADVAARVGECCATVQASHGIVVALRGWSSKFDCLGVLRP
jgi:hypothetical protein